MLSFSSPSKAHESLHEGVGEKAFPVGEEAAEVILDGPGELGHGCEPRVLGVEDSDVAHPGTQARCALR